MLTALERIPEDELALRYARCRKLLVDLLPAAGGMLVSSRLDIYYLTGHLGEGLLWLPLQGEPVLLLRRATLRAQLESPLKNIFTFHSYRELASLCAEVGSPLADCIGVDKAKFSWSMSELLNKHLAGTKFVGCDNVLRKAKAIKTEWELRKMRLAGERHRKALEEMVPNRLVSGMTELEIAHLIQHTFQELGHAETMRMYAHGEENYGAVAAGESGNYPHAFNGPVGVRGMHPAVPFMGDAGTVWKKNMLLTIDFGYSLEGYNSDKTQVYWSGPQDSIPNEVAKAQALCEEIFQLSVDRLKPGELPSAIWKTAREMAVNAGYADGFMGWKKNLMFLGHGVGLNVDELPVFANGFDDPLEKGMVVALEPKIGILGYGITGVENMLEITEHGAVSLTGSHLDIIPIVD